MERRLFYAEIRRNKTQSFFLVSVVLLVLLGLVYIISALVNPVYTTMILVMGTLISLVYVLIGFYASAKIALLSVNAKLASPAKYTLYHDIVDGLCLASGLPKPSLYVMGDPQINAFASGRSPNNAIICITTGALEKLNKGELEGILAHELSHIANYDIRFMTLTAVLVGMVSLIAQIFLRSLWYGSGSDREYKSGLFLIIGIILALVSPLIVSLVQLAISRRREFGADASSVKFTRTPTGLIHALEKIKGNSPMKVSGSLAPLFLSKPNNTLELFQTHPSLEKRISRLRSM